MPKVFAAVKALIIHNDTFLVIKQNVQGTMLWDLPGGRVEYGESPYDTLHREVQEETNLQVDIIKPLGMWWFLRMDQNQVVCTTFLCQPRHTTVDLSKNPTEETISEHRWVKKEEFLTDKYPVSHQSLKELIRKMM